MDGYSSVSGQLCDLSHGLCLLASMSGDFSKVFITKLFVQKYMEGLLL